MKGLKLSLLLALLVPLLASAAKYEYETVPGDPLQTKIYTLPNGLKLFMSVNKAQPRIQTIIAVRVGGKDDPAQTTGLAHYFEHLMFKGTDKFGTSDYAAEKPMLDRIEALFETYRQTTDSTERARIYAEIDSVSYEASKIAIPNEYDKLMSAIGANGTNAYTSYDYTCYVEDIPSNQIDNWAKIQGDRFKNPVLRGFHTELETIYEEKNMSLTKDIRKVWEKMFAVLYPSHPYGRQTVLGTQEHLKNPSITNVKNYHKQWYVPNNMAVIASGDFDPDNMVDIVSKYFGDMKPNTALTRTASPVEKPFEKPVDVTVNGLDAESIYLAWRVPAAAHSDMLAVQVMDEVMMNGRTGLMDINITLPQRLLNASGYIFDQTDAGAYMLVGTPKADQNLDDVRAILLEQVEKLRNGEFSDELVEAVKANMKLSYQRGLTENESRAKILENAFVNNIPWADAVAEIEKLDQITKADIVAVANKYLSPANYTAIYKRQAEDTNVLKIAKPALTPIVMNRDQASQFLLDIQNDKVEPIEPVFADYTKDLKRLKAKNGVPVLYMPNDVNDLFSLVYVYETGTTVDSLLQIAPSLTSYIETPDMTAEQITNEFYKLACSYRIVPQAERTFIVLSGLSENLPKAAALLEKVMANARVPQESYDAFIDRVEKSRENAKLNQGQNFTALQQYVYFGPENSLRNQMSIATLRNIKPEQMMDALRKLNKYEQRVIFWGSTPEKDVVKLVNKTHPVKGKLLAKAPGHKYVYLQPEETVFYIAPYKAKQLYMVGMANRGEKLNHDKEQIRKIYNEYFGGSMNSVVFQEMRESRSLAYSASARMMSPSTLDRPYAYVTTIATQNDKLLDALAAFDEIINDMPRSESAFQLAKAGLDARCRTERDVNDDMAFNYIAYTDMGYDHDPRRELFQAVQTATLDDLEAYQKENVKGNVYRIGILGDIDDLPIDELRKIGKVVILTTEDIFGY